MKNKLLLLLLIIGSFSFNLKAQEPQHLSKWQLRDSIDCVNAIPKVLNYCNYLLTTPCTSAPLDLNAALYVQDWMQHTYNYDFVFDQKFYTIVMIYPCVYNRYVAALVRTAIEDHYPQNTLALQLKAITEVLEYCLNPVNEVNVGDNLDGYYKALKNGTLEQKIMNDFSHYY